MSQALTNKHSSQRLFEPIVVRWRCAGENEYHRELAERCRKLAEDIPEPEANAHMLDVARQYDKLAEEAQAKSR